MSDSRRADEATVELSDSKTRPAAVDWQPAARTGRPHDAVLSPIQRGVWVSDLVHAARSMYLVVDVTRWRGPLDVDNMRACYRELAVRHDALRTTFHDGDPVVQRRRDEPVLNLVVQDLEERSETLEVALADLGLEDFDLAVAPPWRVTVLCAGPDDHVVALEMHHLIADEWSMRILGCELATLYEARRTGVPSTLDDVPLDYGDYAEWHAARSAGAAGSRDLQHWRDALAGMPTTLDLLVDLAPREGPPPSEVRDGWPLSPQESTRLRELAAAAEVTPFAVMTTLFAIVLGQHARSSEIVLGTAVSGRPSRSTEGVVGLFANLLPLPIRLRGTASLTEAFRETFAAFLGVLDHQDVTLEQIVSDLGVRRVGSRLPLCHAVVDWAEPGDGATPIDGLEVSPVPVASGVPKSDLMLVGTNLGDRLYFELIADGALFEPATVTTLLDQLHTAIRGALATPTALTEELSLVSDRDRARLTEWSAGAAWSPEATIQQVFETTVASDPDAVALTGQGRAMSYAELDVAAKRLAQVLREEGVGEDRPVGLAIPRSYDTMVVALAILKADGAYLYLDSGAPVDRNRLLLQSSGAVLVVTTQSSAAGLEEAAGSLNTLVIDDPEIERRVASAADDAPTRGSRPDSLAYISFTSGSTGPPKCVGVTHRNVVRLAHRTDYLDYGSGHGFIQLSTLSFDGSLIEVWTSLLNGGWLVLPPPGPLDMEDVSRWLGEYSVTTMFATTALFHQLVEEECAALGQLSQLLVGGDVASQPAFRKALADPALRDTALVHIYGPTENTGVSTALAVDAALDARVPIGCPIKGSTAYVVEEGLRLAPVGVVGQLCVGGAGVARGYINDPRLTAERFVPDPFSAESGARMYCTGDAVRWRPDGKLDFVGRIDRQLKIRGFRVEPAEIEARILVHPEVAESLVLPRSDAGQHKRLAAYVVMKAGATLTEASLRSFVSAALPDYMVPASFVVLDRFPLNVQGKIDRAALPDDRRAEADARARRQPSTPAQHALADAWCTVLHVEEVGLDDNFFELGGDSILAIRVASQLRQKGFRVAPKDVFEHQTVAELASVSVSVSPSAGLPHADSNEAGQPVPLTPIEHWFVESYGAANHLNQAVRLASDAPVDCIRLRTVIDALVTSHDALRLRLRPDGSGGWLQEVASTEPRELLAVVELAETTSPEARERELLAHAAAMHRSHDLGVGPLMRTILFPGRGHGPDELVMAIHHLAVDTVSWDVLLSQLDMGYQQLSRGQTLALPPSGTSFAGWARALVAHAGSEAARADRERWRAMSANLGATEPLPGAPARNTVGSARTASASLDATTTEALLRRPVAAHGVDVKAILLTIVARTLHTWTGGRSFHIDVEGHGRDTISSSAIDVSGTVGWFTAIYPMLLPVEGEDPVAQLLAVDRQVRGSSHGSSYGIARYLAPEAEAITHSRAELVFNYHGRIEASRDSGTFRRFDAPTGGPLDPSLPRPYAHEVTAAVVQGELRLDWNYPRRGYAPAQMQRLVHKFVDHARLLVTNT